MDTKPIITSAKNKGLCKEYVSDFQKDGSLKNLCAKYFEGSDWTMKKDFPSMQMLRAFKGESEEFGLHTDYKGDDFNVNSIHKQMAFFGDSEAKINVSGFSVFEIYIRHNSKININAKGNARLIICLLDNTTVKVNCADESNAVIYQYGKSSNFNITGAVDVKERTFEK